MKSAYLKGLDGETMALKHLKRKGFKYVESRYRRGHGEIDLIMKDKKVLVFVEVKYRKSGHIGDGLIAVTPQKQNRMISAAMCYIVENSLMHSKMRFDVVEITNEGIVHIENAF